MNMVQIHGLSSAWVDQGIAHPTFSYLAPKHFYVVVLKASHCSFGTITLFKDKYKSTYTDTVKTHFVLIYLDR